MNSVHFEQTLHLSDEYEVIVVGGGPAGCAAAAAAARRGAHTLLIEASCSLGGMGTIGMVPAWCPFSDKNTIIYRGIAQEVFEKTKASMPHVGQDDLDWVPIDFEALKRVYDDLVSEAGVDVLFDTNVSAVQSAEGEIVYIVASNQAGLSAYKAPIYIDCTGDADLVAYAGGEFEYGDETDGEVQPATLCFILTNVDEYAYRTGPVLHMSQRDCAVYDIVKSEKYPLVTDGHSCNNLIGPGTVGFNAGHLWNVDARDPLSISKNMILGRKLADQFTRGLAEFSPKAFANAYLVSTASVMGIRESRRVIGDYQLTLDDYLSRRSFEDEIGRNSYFIDIHNSLRERDLILRGELTEEANTRRYDAGESHGIPYRCLLPKGLKNVLVAGKSISSDRAVQGSVRVMPPSLVTGQAAGTAAALAAKLGKQPREIDVQMLRKMLREDGAWFQ